MTDKTALAVVGLLLQITDHVSWGIPRLTNDKRFQRDRKQLEDYKKALESIGKED